MAEIKIQAVLERANFDTAIQNLEKQLKAIEAKPIKISIDVTGLQNGTAELGKLATANAKLESAAAKSATAQARIAEANARVAVSANQVAVAQERTAQAHERTEQAAIKSSASQARAAKEAEDATKAVEQATIRYSETLSAMAVRGVWRAITNEIRQSLAAMKEVDRELVTIRKVTGFGQEKISAIGQGAYSVASQYGVLPQEYLESVANFARAGYKDVSTTLGELAVKTQLVGDVSASTANQMLLAVDAAYKYGGSAEKLNAVLDGMNEIDNNFATSIDKISSGLGKVTSIAAQAGVGIDELSAAVGTITAVTQRSGTEAATALRALFLNIMGDTKTEIEDGAKWTAGEIEGLRDVINKYAPDVVAAADAEKKLINPMEAVAALSKAMKDGLLTEQDLMQMVSDIGGKLRSSQLLALIQNWDMYSAQLDAFRNSAGSAGEEVARMLDSWEVKANQLSASWMKLTSDIVDTSAIKGVLDILRGIVEVLDFGGGLPGKILAVSAAITAVGLAFKSLRVAAGAKAIFSILSNPGVWLATGSIVAISAIANLIDHLTVTQKELEENANLSAEDYGRQKDNLQSVNDQIEENARLMREIVSNGADITDADRERLSVLQQQTAELELQAKIQGYKTEKSGREAAEAAMASINGRGLYSADVQATTTAQWSEYDAARIKQGNLEGLGPSELLAYLGYVRNTMAEVDAEIKGLPDGDESIEELGDLRDWLQSVETMVNDQLVKYVDETTGNLKTIDNYLEDYVRNTPESERTAWQKSLLEWYESTTANVRQVTDAMGITTGTAASGTTVGGAAEEPTPSAWQLQTDQHAAQVQALNAAIKEFNDVGVISANTYGLMADAGLNVSDSLIAMDDGYVIAKDDLQKFIDATKAWYDKYGLEMPEALGSVGEGAADTSSSLSELANNALTLQDNAYGAAKALQDLQNTMKATGEKGDTLDAWQKQYASAMALVGEGAWNANQVRGLADFVFGAENIDAMGGYRAAAKELGNDLVKNLLSGDARETLQWLHKTYGDLINDGNNLIKQNEDGTWSFMVNDMESLSKVLGVSQPLLSAFMDKLSLFGDVQDEEGINKLLDGMAEGVEKVGDGTKKVNLESFVSQMLDLGKNSAQIRELLNQMANMPEIKVEGDTSKLQEIIDKETEIKSKADEGANIDITATNNVEGPASEAEETVEIPDQNIDIGATNSTEVAAGAAEETVDIPNVNIDIGATDNASGTAGNVKAAVEAIPTEINIKIKATTDGLPTEKTTSGLGTVGGGLSTYGLDAVSGAAPFIPHDAAGTNFAEGGPTLVNELGPELIAQNGRAFIANGGKPTITNLARGAIVYNAEDTRQLLVGGGISSYGIESKAGVFDINMNGGGDDKPKPPPAPPSKGKTKKSDDEWWQILQESYEYALAKAKDTVNQLDLKITHIKNEIADAKRPLEDQIKEYEKINKQIDRQIQLLNRAKERATKPIQDQIDALKAQKDVQDEQLALEEKQKAVEEARANLQNAQQERTIRFYNQETGHWEWMADQKAIDDAQKNLDSAEKALADQEFNMQISALEREKDRIEKEFDDQITQLNEQKTVNEDAIYALNEAIDAIDDAYAPELNALEREKELMDRELSDTEAEWAHLQFQRQKKPKGNVNKAANKLGAKGKAAKEIIDSLSGSIKDIESAAAAGTLDALTASVANSLIYGSPSTVASAVGTGVGYNGGMADSHDIIINGIVFSNEGAYKSFTDGLAALGIYAGE